MHTPEQFEEARAEVMHALIRANPLATLVTHASTGLNANHIPLHLHERPAPFGTLHGHIARANPLMREIAQGIDALAIFHGPDAYISPSWYATKAETGRVVPTWNYAVVHAYGVLRIVEDAAWLRAQLDVLTNHNEATFPQPWAVSDAPPEHIEKLMAAIVGIELVVTKMVGKWKVSQNQPAQNKASVITGLRASGQPGSEAMAALVEARAEKDR
jgi:transcriptional regulator